MIWFCGKLNTGKTKQSNQAKGIRIMNDWAPVAPLAEGDTVTVFTQVTIPSGISFRREWQWLPAIMLCDIGDGRYHYRRADGLESSVDKSTGESYIRREGSLPGKKR